MHQMFCLFFFLSHEIELRSSSIFRPMSMLLSFEKLLQNFKRDLIKTAKNMRKKRIYN